MSPVQCHRYNVTSTMSPIQCYQYNASDTSPLEQCHWYNIYKQTTDEVHKADKGDRTDGRPFLHRLGDLACLTGVMRSACHVRTSTQWPSSCLDVLTTRPYKCSDSGVTIPEKYYIYFSVYQFSVLIRQSHSHLLPCLLIPIKNIKNKNSL